MSAKPLVVSTAPGALTAAREQLEREGWLVMDGFGIPYRQWDISSARIVCVGKVFEAGDAADALLAASRGAGLLVELNGRGDLLATFVEDLRHLGPVELRGYAPPDSLVALDDEQKSLLKLLAEGRSIVEAARILHMSRRTATRRAAEIRKALGARTTSEAVVLSGAQRN